MRSAPRGAYFIARGAGRKVGTMTLNLLNPQEFADFLEVREKAGPLGYINLVGGATITEYNTERLA